MTEHLPECWAKDPSDPEAWCICDELRACEQRALNAARQAVEVLLNECWERFYATPVGIKELNGMVKLNRAIAAIDALREKQ